MENNKVTIQDILKAKKLLEDRKKEPFYSQVFNGEIEIEDISANKIVEIINSPIDDALRADMELIYACCPIFRSKDLQVEFEVKDPIDTVAKSFADNIKEIDALAKHIMKRYGYFTNEAETIKKH